MAGCEAPCSLVLPLGGWMATASDILQRAAGAGRAPPDSADLARRRQQAGVSEHLSSTQKRTRLWLINSCPCSPDGIHARRALRTTTVDPMCRILSGESLGDAIDGTNGMQLCALTPLGRSSKCARILCAPLPNHCCAFLNLAPFSTCSQP